MAISINWGTRVIYVPKNYLTLVSGVLYELDVNQFRLDLKDLEDSEDGMSFPQTHNHNTEVTLSGVAYARIVEIINDYTVEFEDGQYTVRCVGANHNLADVKVANSVSLIVGNSAGLVAGLDAVVENNMDVIQTLRLMLSAMAAKVSGAQTATITFRDTADTKDRIVATVDQYGNRSAVTLDAD